MSFVVRPTARFMRELKRLRKRYASIDADVEELGEVLSQEPHQGAPIGMSCYKVRLAIKSKGKGKSGGARVITCVIALRESVVLLSIHDKSEQETISDAMLRQMLDDSGLL